MHSGCLNGFRQVQVLWFVCALDAVRMIPAVKPVHWQGFNQAIWNGHGRRNSNL